MDKQLKNALIILAVSILISVVAFIKPLLRQAGAVKFMNSVLRKWEEGDFAGTLNYFIHPDKSPPISSIDYYEIRDKKFFKVDGAFTAHFLVYIELGDDNNIPDKREWLFVVKKSAAGWKIADFRIINKQSFLQYYPSVNGKTSFIAGYQRINVYLFDIRRELLYRA